MDLLTHWNGCEVYLHQGDITVLEVDAIVNAANSGLRGGGGVDGAIHGRGGPAIMEECRKIIARIGSLPTGQAALTSGGRLAARHVIHAVGPIYHAGDRAVERLLSDAYRNSMAVARENSLRSLAFPCISTGIYGYPADDACRIALRAVQEEVEQYGGLDRIIFCAFLADDYKIYQSRLTPTN